MHKYLRFLFAIAITCGFMMTGCGKDVSKPDPQPDTMQNKLTLLKVDYQTLAFEGGKTYQFPANDVDSIPLKVNYQAPGDFGGITFIHQPTYDTIFHGGIIWMGQGQITQPASFKSPQSYASIGQTVQKPGNVHYYQYSVPRIEDLDSLSTHGWQSVNDLKLVQGYLSNGAKVGMYLYPPTVGAFDPAKAKWIIYLYDSKVPQSQNDANP